jgi:WD40 repeat protein
VAHQLQGTKRPEAKQVAEPKPEGREAERPTPKEQRQAHTDRYGDLLPEGAVTRLGTVRLRHSERITTVAYSLDGKTLFSGGCDNVIRMWDVATGKELRRFQGHTSAVMAVALSLDGRLLASGGNDGMIRLWQVAAGREVFASRGHMGSAVFCITLSPDGKTLASGGGGNGDSALALWDLATGRELHRLGRTTYEVRAVAEARLTREAKAALHRLAGRPGAKR